MNKLFKTITTLMIVSILFSGCCSYKVLNDSKAIKASRLRNGGAGVAVDVSNLDALMERPFLQFLAALGDAAIMYGVYEGARAIDESINDDDDGPGGVVVSGDQNNVTVQQGNGNEYTTTDTITN